MLTKHYIPNRDDLPPDCPACKRTMREVQRDMRGRRPDAAPEDDWDAVARVVYQCHKCKTFFEDRLDGSELRIVRARRA